MSEPKTVTKREVEIFVELAPASYAYSDKDFDLQGGETLAAFIARQRERGETACSTAQDLDLFEDVELHLQVIEHYDDGTKKTVDRATWTDEP